MPSDNESSASEGQIKIVRGRVDSLLLYEVTDSELKTLERGSPSSIYLDFAISLLSVALSLVVAVVTTTIKSLTAYLTFLVVISVSIVAGLVLLALWWRSRESVREVLQEIKNRIPSSEAGA